MTVLYVVHRDNTTDDQECSGFGTCLCGDCVCTKEGVSGLCLLWHAKLDPSISLVWSKSHTGTVMLLNLSSPERPLFLKEENHLATSGFSKSTGRLHRGYTAVKNSFLTIAVFAFLASSWRDSEREIL